MHAEHIVGWITLILAVAMAVIALPKQIVKNHRDNRANITIWLAILPFAVYASRMVYGVIIGSYYIVIPDACGAFFSAVLLYQVVRTPRLRVLELLGI